MSGCGQLCSDRLKKTSGIKIVKNWCYKESYDFRNRCVVNKGARIQRRIKFSCFIIPKLHKQASYIWYFGNFSYCIWLQAVSCKKIRNRLLLYLLRKDCVQTDSDRFVSELSVNFKNKGCQHYKTKNIPKS